MRIGIDARPLISDYPSGIGIYLLNIIQYISKHDFENEYVLYSNKKIRSDIQLGQQFEERIIDGKIGTLWLRFLVCRELKKDNINIFWGTQHILPKKVKGIKYILTVHDLALLINPKWGSRNNSIMQNIFLRSSVKDADFIITDSLSTQKDLINICKVRNVPMKCIYLGGIDEKKQVITKETVEAFKKRYQIKNKYFCYVGTIEPRKNIDTIVKAFEKVSDDYNGIELILAGGLGWRYEGIIDCIKNSPKVDQVKMVGYVSKEDKDILLYGSEAFLFPSHYEGFGIPILEAMENETIVITDKISSLPEVAGEAALYVENETDYNELAMQMKKVLEMSIKERDNYIKMGKKQVRKFSWEKCAQETLQVIKIQKG